jgi:biofilm PGA synthesis lipoprotein PgaB
MPRTTGTWLCSVALCLLLAAPARATGRGHEVQLRGNHYPLPPSPASLRAAGLDRVIVRVFSDDEKDGGLYFSGSGLKTVRPFLEGWAALFANGRAGLWAWMGARYFLWFDDARLLDSEWRDGRKRLIPRLDLFNPDAEKLIIGLFSYLAAKPIGGILIQDDLTLRRNEGFSSWGKAFFALCSGMEADERRMARQGSAQNRAWEECKCRRVAQLLEKVVQACKTANPAIRVGMNVHYELPLQPLQARSWYAHDAEALAASGLDFFYLMAYHRQIRAELVLSEGENRSYFARMADAALARFGRRLVVKLQVRDWRNGEPIPYDELKAYYDLIPAGVGRVCFAAADPGDIPLIARILSKKNQ